MNANHYIAEAARKAEKEGREVDPFFAERIEKYSNDPLYQAEVMMLDISEQLVALGIVDQKKTTPAELRILIGDTSMSVQLFLAALWECGVKVKLERVTQE